MQVTSEEDIKGKVSIYKPDDCYDIMKYQLANGKVKGSTTYNEELNQAWTWRLKESNIWTGYANEGKSQFLKQLCLKKALEENKKIVFSSPEDFPPEEFFDDMIHTIAGVTTDKDYPHVIGESLYDKMYDFIRDLFIFVYVKPPHNTVKGVLEEFRAICANEDVFACVLDPILKFAWPKNFPDNYERYASYVGSLSVDFCRETNTSFHVVMHQVTPTFDAVKYQGEDKKKYSEPSMYRVKGGGSWADGFDNVLSIWRPNYAFDKFDTEVQFASQKIKKQKLVGVPQRLSLRFDRKTNRYRDFNDSRDLFDFDKFLK
jgi:twinkle protein